MTVGNAIQARIGGLGELENSLWHSFKAAEDNYVPSIFNPWKVTRNFVQLRRLGHLKLYEFYPVYALIAVVFAGTAVIGRQHWLLLAYLVSLMPAVVFLSRYTKQFAFQKTNMLGLDRVSFGVAHLPLLVYGVMRTHEASRDTVLGRRAAALTKTNLSSVIKLVKGGMSMVKCRTGSATPRKKLSSVPWFP